MTITKPNYVLIDFENTQSISLEKLKGLPVKVIIFVGQNQKSLPVELVKRLLEFPGIIEISESAGMGKNALDFQLAFHAGRLYEREPNIYLHIVSKDKGFDPLIAQIRGQGGHCSRVDEFASLSFLQPPKEKAAGEKADFTTYPLKQRVEFALTRITKMPPISRPRKLKTLRSSIHTQFTKQLSEAEIHIVVAELVKSGKVVVGPEENITYGI